MRILLFLCVTAILLVAVQGTATFALLNAAMSGLSTQYPARRAYNFDSVFPDMGNQNDVICFNEVYETLDRTQMINTLAVTHPNVIAGPNRNPVVDGVGSCGCDGVPEFAPLQVCLATFCATDPTFGCLAVNCNDEFQNLPNICLGCLSQFAYSLQIGEITVTQVFATCGAALPGDLFSCSVTTSDGLMLFSKYPIKNPEITPLDSPSLQRSILCGTIEHPDRDMEVCCSHLTASSTTGNEARIATPVDPTVAQVLVNQSEELSTHAMDRANGKPLIVLADLNSSPEFFADGLWGEATDAYNVFVLDGFEDPYLEQVTRCTWCVDINPTLAAYPAFPALPSNIEQRTHGVVYDHILHRNFKGKISFSAQRIVDDPVVPLTADSLYPSDHFGSRLIVEKCESSSSSSASIIGANFMLLLVLLVLSLIL
eukprot:CAMPEP_0201475042 /NCGR_PEP_ID=MMETSP0151_2-20130828/534_1 /ASSEMBLY_ACC=CAM_ASM_000257 /TAXON_ID=200890 /ORGANISM="Paramoeba atlantica, Strain 621/1 / CCAP 1560/9" /LENGTH=426 /DNA_ID=CAMNT_0047855043 /DNA_START=62 /DNA_END=1342 /DNA_ORIENTATION=-